MKADEWFMWLEFRQSGTETITTEEQILIATLHSKYFNHKYKVPCSCKPSKARKIFQKWIDELNHMFETQPKPKIR